MAKPKKKKKQRDIYQEVTDKIIAKLEEGTAPWHKPWGSPALARNYESGNIYTGINMVLFNLVYTDDEPYYLTFNQVKKLGGKVKKGSKARQLVYYNVMYKDGNGKRISEATAKAKRKAGEEVEKIPFLKSYGVFTIADIEGIEFSIPEEKRYPENVRLAACEKILHDMPKRPKFQSKAGERKACYVPVIDTVRIPVLDRFEITEAYYNTLFHEVVHATGHASRLNRDGITKPIKFGSDNYAKEELVAELGASFLCGITQINREVVLDNTAAYIANWLERLKNDKKLVFQAAAKAKQAVEFILDKSINDKPINDKPMNDKPINPKQSETES